MSSKSAHNGNKSSKKEMILSSECEKSHKSLKNRIEQSVKKILCARNPSYKKECSFIVVGFELEAGTMSEGMKEESLRNFLRKFYFCSLKSLHRRIE